MPTTVTLLLKGSLVLFAKEGQPTGSVRILKAPPPNHVLTLSFQRQPPGGQFGSPIAVPQIANDLNLTVNNPVNPNITLRDKAANINRQQSPTNQDSFKWLVDLENSELYDGTIGAKKSGFKQVLTFNSGELFNDNDQDNPSYNFLLIQRGSDANYEDFGYVSIRIGIAFSANGTVVFTNGNNVVFDSSQDPAGTNYRINLENDAATHPSLCTDANHYYKAVGSGIPPEERILFASVTQNDALLAMADQARLRGNDQFANSLASASPPAGPEAACFPAYISRTEP
jgi:hypothetical protein